jgi:hypothetical protein
MSKVPVFLILAFSAGVAPGASGFDTTLIPVPPLLRDGFVLRGVDGRLSGPDANDAWFFELAADVNDLRDVLKTGTKLEMLPSATLEKMIADGRARSEMTFRLWNGRVTRYKGRNFIFPSYFLPVREPKEPEPNTREKTPAQTKNKAVETPPAREREPIVRDANDVVSIPSDLLRKVQATREVMAARERRMIDPNLADALRMQRKPRRYRRGSDSVFVDRTGFLAAEADGSVVFTLDALGRTVQRKSFRLLPCEALELAELKMAADFEPVRFKVAGILTKYEDTDYLLLQKATPSYSHGNFGR